VTVKIRVPAAACRSRRHRRARLQLAAAAALALCLVGGCGPGSTPDGFGDDAHHELDLLAASDADDGGRLAVEYDFDRPVETSLAATLGGVSLFTATDPGFNLLAEDEPEHGLFALAEGVTVTVEITAVEDGAAVKVGDATLDAPGEAAVLGTSPEIHLHPEWQLALPEGVNETRSLSFKLTTGDPRYTESAEITLILEPHADGDDHDDDDHV
jgi:hypothetical protein